MDEKLKFPIDRIPDSYLPEKVRQSGLFCFGLAALCGGLAVVLRDIWLFLAICALLVLCLGVFVLLWHKNQAVLLLSEEELLYRSLWGNVCRLKWSELVETRRNWDSLTLVFPRKKVHIEQIAILSPELRKHLGGGSFKPSGSL